LAPHSSPISGVIAEIIDGCNMKCPTCIAASLPGTHGARTVEALTEALELHVRTTGPISILMLSGGEPTVHPNFFSMLDAACDVAVSDRVLVITNGRLIADDREFVAQLAARNRVEVYLQFDSTDAGALLDLRGEDLVDQRLRALANLAEFGVPTTLVCVAKADVTLDEAPGLVRLAYLLSNVRGITFQPIREVGRLATYVRDTHETDLSVVRKVLIEAGVVTEAGLAPHPLSPNGISVAYLERGAMSVEHARDATARIYADYPGTRGQLFAGPPQIDPAEYADVFGVAVVEYLDRRNFSTSAVEEATIAFVDEKHGLVPVDTYYAFYATPPAPAN
jgi:uncharacterized Fe-S cluster-containing radical SAM superfamily protein